LSQSLCFVLGQGPVVEKKNGYGPFSL
jgi:hypothetical protein